MHDNFCDDLVFAAIRCSLPEYSFNHLPCKTHGGGICVIYRSDLKVWVPIIQTYG